MEGVAKVSAGRARMRRPPVWLLVLELLLLTLVAALAVADEKGRPYHRVLVKDIPTTSWTHVCTTGLVTLVRKQADGDIHVRVENGDSAGAFIVAEIIPTLLPKAKDAIRVPKKGEWVEVCGIVREDKRHGWFELHPVERLH